MSKKRDPMSDDHYGGNDDQIEDLKNLVRKLRPDAARFQHLQNIPVKVAQSFFWNYSSRRERAKAIDKDMEVPYAKV